MMAAPRINPALMSAATRANLERIQGQMVQKSFSLMSNIGSGKPNGLKPKTEHTRGKKKTLTPDMADSLVKSVNVSEDGNVVRIVMALNPSQTSTSQQKGVFVGKDGRVHFFTKAKIAKAAKTLKMALSPYAHYSRSWGEVPIEVVFDYYFPYPSGTPKKQQHKIGPMNERPDASNITKGICDAMTEAGFWSDDSFINTETSRKRRTTGPSCTKITITNLKPKFEALYRDTEEHDAPTLFSQSTATPSETNPLSEMMAHGRKTISQKG